MFDIHFDRQRRLITVVRYGLSDREEAEHYAEEMARVLAMASAGGLPFDVLLNLASGSVLPQDAVAPPRAYPS